MQGNKLSFEQAKEKIGLYMQEAQAVHSDLLMDEEFRLGEAALEGPLEMPGTAGDFVSVQPRPHLEVASLLLPSWKQIGNFVMCDRQELLDVLERKAS